MLERYFIIIVFVNDKDYQLTYMLFAFDKMLVFYARSYSIMYCLYAYNSGYVIISGDLGMWQHKGSLFGYGFTALSLFP